VAEIILLRGQIALVDDEDTPKVIGYSWYLGTRGYVMAWDVSLKRPIYLHRLVMGSKPGEKIDHRHHNKLDNRKSELRKCTQLQNMGNARVQQRPKSSVFKGVCWNKALSKWQASIKVTLRRKKFTKYLGVFTSETEAARTYNEAALNHFGAEYALLNPI
jgi:hypothetical protein